MWIFNLDRIFNSSPSDRINKLRSRSNALLSPLRKALSEVIKLREESFNELYRIEKEKKELELAMVDLEKDQEVLDNYRSQLEKTLGIMNKED